MYIISNYTKKYTWKVPLNWLIYLDEFTVTAAEDGSQNGAVTCFPEKMSPRH